MKMTRVPCPQCQAPAGTRCIQQGYFDKTNTSHQVHIPRQRAYLPYIKQARKTGRS